MIGTIFSVKLAIRLIPPMKMIAATIATKIPTAIVGTWNALLNGNSDRVGLYHITHESQCKDDGYREETGKELPKSAFEYVFDVIYRTADYGTVFYFTGVLSHNCFSINRSHTEKRADPHPENGTGSTGCNSGSGSGNITGTDLSSNGSSQCLKRTETLLRFFHRAAKNYRTVNAYLRQTYVPE